MHLSVLRLLASSCIIVGSSAAQTVDHPLQIRGEIVAPQLVKQVEPHFSPAMRKEPTVREVVVHIVVDKKGNVATLAIKEPGDPEFDRSALNAVRRYKFRLAMLRSEAVAVELNIDVHFQVDNN